jgi:hypothetical protein
MKANELRIGNYTEKGIVHEIRYLAGELGCTLLDSIFDSSCGVFYKTDHVDPIPLTEQWLKDLHDEDKRFRVQECGTIFYIEISKDINLYVDLEVKEMWIEGHTGELVEEYHQLLFKGEVHSFQNLYFCLTGKELVKNG